MTIQIIKTTKELDYWRNQHKNQVHFVPTMGGLHLGHGQLIKEAKRTQFKKPASVLLSIFVNPLQFADDEDFAEYPRNFSKDLELAQLSGADAVWVPKYEDIYPGGEAANFKIKAPKMLTNYLCGAHRKNHFDGVATVIIRLLRLAKPKVIFLGEKDWQQYIIIRQLINDFEIPVKIKGIATVRDPNGLALSSRNQYLNKLENIKALELPKALQKALKEFKKTKKVNLQGIKSSLEKNDLKVEYVEAVDPNCLTPIENAKSICLVAAAVRCGNTRLIDHIFLMNRSPIVAIDGPAGAGKSTVTKTFANKLGLLYLDTGAMYRAITWFVLKEKIDPNDDQHISEIIQDIEVDLKTSNKGQLKVLLNSEDITELIRSPEVTELVSIIASKHSVRKKLTNQQKKLGHSGGLVAEGRDIGTAVFPNADLKIFLTATPKERARRRALDMKGKGFQVPDLLELENQIVRRDALDSNRDIAPLLKAKDAKELITDGMSIEEVVETLIELFRLQIPEEIWPSP